MMEHEYNDLQEEVNEKSKLLNQLRKRYKAALAEIQDLESEHLNEKADLLETIRTLEIDLGFFKSVVYMMMTENNLYQIKTRSQYDGERSEWEIPPFVMKGKQINLPKLGLQKAMKYIEEEKNNLVVDFKQSGQDSDDYNQEAVSKSAIRLRNQKKNKVGSRNKSQAPAQARHHQLQHHNHSAPVHQDDVRAAQDSDYSEEAFDEFGGGLHDYKER